MERLQKILARAGLASRREAELMDPGGTRIRQRRGHFQIGLPSRSRER